MLIREITYNFDDNSLITDIPYTYILNNYILRITIVDNDNNPVDLSSFTYIEGGVGNISDTSPLSLITNLQDTDLWADANLTNGKIVCKINLIDNALISDLGRIKIARYYLQVIGGDAPLIENNYNTICQFPIYIKNTIWRP
jgi:hypothetical protein